MCSINFIHTKKGNNAGIAGDIMLQGVLHRGNEQFGVYDIKNNTQLLSKDYSLTKKDLLGINSDCLMIHGRFATSTKIRYTASHPFIIEDEEIKISFIHNGVIHNHKEIEEKQKEVYGFKYQSYCKNEGKYNDSEVLAYEFYLYIKGIKKSIDVVGSVAFIAYTENKKTGKRVVYFYHNAGSPLTYTNNASYIALSSEGLEKEVVEGVLYEYDIDDMIVTEVDALDIALYTQQRYNNFGFGDKSINGLKYSFDDDYENYLNIDDKTLDILDKLQKQYDDAIFNNSKRREIMQSVEAICEQYGIFDEDLEMFGYSFYNESIESI